MVELLAAGLAVVVGYLLWDRGSRWRDLYVEAVALEAALQAELAGVHEASRRALLEGTERALEAQVAIVRAYQAPAPLDDGGQLPDDDPMPTEIRSFIDWLPEPTRSVTRAWVIRERAAGREWSEIETELGESAEQVPLATGGLV